MKGVLYIRNKDGKFIPIHAIKGKKGDPGGLVPHAEMHATGGEDEITPASIGAATAADVENAQEAAENALNAANSKAPSTHAEQHKTGGTDPITPEDIGAVNKSGDTVNGNLDVNGAFSVKRADTNRTARTVAHNNTDKEVDFQNYGDDNNYVSLRVATETKGLGDAAKITQMKNGQFSSFTLLHTGNKEKIFTYGTEDIEAGTPSPYPDGTLHFVYE